MSRAGPVKDHDSYASGATQIQAGPRLTGRAVTCAPADSRPYPSWFITTVRVVTIMSVPCLFTSSPISGLMDTGSPCGLILLAHEGCSVASAVAPARPARHASAGSNLMPQRNRQRPPQGTATPSLRAEEAMT